MPDIRALSTMQFKLKHFQLSSLFIFIFYPTKYSYMMLKQVNVDVKYTHTYPY